jgi:hypothetical protein
MFQEGQQLLLLPARMACRLTTAAALRTWHGFSRVTAHFSVEPCDRSLAQVAATRDHSTDAQPLPPHLITTVAYIRSLAAGTNLTLKAYNGHALDCQGSSEPPLPTALPRGRAHRCSTQRSLTKIIRLDVLVLVNKECCTTFWSNQVHHGFLCYVVCCCCDLARSGRLL